MHDPLNRVIERIDPLLHTSKTEYDGNSNVIAQIDANGHRTEYKYDPMDRNIEIDVDPAFRARMMAEETRLDSLLQQQIDDFLR